MTDATVTLNLYDALGEAYEASRTKIWVEFNTDNGFIVDENGNTRVGAGRVTINSDGSAQITGIPVPSVATNPTDFQVRINYDAPPRAAQQRGVKRDRGTFGWMTITVDADLSDLVAEQYAPPSWQSTFIAQAQAYLAQQESLAGIDDTDSAVAYNVEYGPETTAALSASIDAGLGGLSASRDAVELAWANFRLLPDGEYDGSMTRGGDVTLGFNTATATDLVIDGGKLRLDAQGASYMWRAYDTPLRSVTVEFEFGAGTTDIAGVNVSLSRKDGSDGESSGGATGPNGVFTNSIHTTIHGDNINLGAFDAGTLSALLQVQYADLTVGQRYAVTIARTAWNVIEVTDPYGTVHTVRDWRIAKLWGRTMGFEHYRPGVLNSVDYFPTDREPIITGISVGSRAVARSGETPVTTLGLPNAAPASTAASALASTLTYYYPFAVAEGEDLALLQARTEVTTAGAGGATARCGIVRLDGALQAKQLIADLGTVAVDSTGVKTWEPTGTPLTLAGVALTEPRTTDKAAFGGSGDLAVTVAVTLADYTPTAVQMLCGQWATGAENQAGFRMWLNPLGRVVFVRSPDGTAASAVTYTSTASVPFTDGTKGYIRATLDVDDGAGGHAVTFETSTDGSTWSALGTPVTGSGVAVVHDSTAPLAFGGHYVASQVPMTGELHEGILSRGGVEVAHPVFEGRKPTFRDAQGNTWTAPTAEPWVELEPGLYALAFHCSANTTFRVARYLSPLIPAPLLDTLGASPFVSSFYVAEAYGAFADPPTPWTTMLGAANPGLASPVQLAWSAV